MLRRRLDRHGRMALATAWTCAEGLDSVQFVFASRHGDLDRTLELLTALGNKDMLSPTSFSLSVHNSTAACSPSHVATGLPPPPWPPARIPWGSACSRERT